MTEDQRAALRAHIDRHEWPEAVQLWRSAPRSNTASVEAARQLAQSLLTHGQPAMADEVLRELAAHRPNLIWMLQLRCEVAAQLGDAAARVDALRRLFELAPESPRALADLLSALLAQGRNDEAQAASQEHAAHVSFAMSRLGQWEEPAAPGDEDDAARARRLYLDLLERAVSNWIYADPSNRLGQMVAFDPQRRSLGKDIPSVGHTMIGLQRLRHLRTLAEQLVVEGIAGDFVEAGVWRGGACILLAGVLRAHGQTQRRVVAADSFAGLPPPDPRYPKDALTTFDFHTRPELAVDAQAVQANFERYGLWSEQVVLLQGLFCDTLPTYPYGPIALLRMDGDLYSSTMDTLVDLYDRVVPGGCVICDDYGVVIDARRAVLDFRTQRGIRAEMLKIDQDAVFWRKP